MRSVLGRICGILAIGLAMVFTSTASAGPTGSQGFADIGAPTANTGDINTSVIFNLSAIVSTGSQSGVFVGFPSTFFGPDTFNSTIPASFTLANAAFGVFHSTSITEISNSPGQVAFFILGMWTPGTYPPLSSSGSGPFAASDTISFTQTPAHTGAISDSSTFSVPPAGIVPEPGSLTLMALGCVGLGLYGRFRRVLA